MFARTTAAALALVLASASAAGAQATEPTIVDNGVGDAVVVPLNKSIPSIDAGDTQWIALNWTSLNAEARNLKVTAIGSEGVTVDYPEFALDGSAEQTNNGYSSGYNDSTVSESEIDYTALKLTVDADVTGPMALTVMVSYESDSGTHVNQHEMPIGDDDGDGGIVPISTTPAVPACDLIEFEPSSNNLTFKLRNTTSSALDFELVIPDANYEASNMAFNGNVENISLSDTENSDGSFTITMRGEIPAGETIGGNNRNAPTGKFTPATGEPFFRCA